MISLCVPALALGGRVILRDVAVTLRAGSVCAICGANGAGKTTLLRGLAGLLPGTPGRDPRRVAYVPQGARAVWGMRVREVVALGRIAHGDADAGAVERAMALCGVADLQGVRVDRISGGQARRVMLARALATEPEVLLLDEPTADLDPAAGHAVMRLLRDWAGGGRSVAVVLHALDLAQAYADRMLLVDGGRIAADGGPGEVMPLAARAFGMRLGVDPAPRLVP